MDARIGLEYIVENRDYVAKLGTALDTHNETVKKQVFELLSALCAYSEGGYARAIETLDFYKNLKKERYRFKIVINELEQSCAAPMPFMDYQVALLAFINCVIISEPQVEERIRIRNELIGLKVLPLLHNLRKVAQGVSSIIEQLDVFVDQQDYDEANSLQAPNGINLNSHLDVFYAILRQVADKPLEGPFLHILQHLLQIDPKEPLSDVIWDTAERLVHRATLLKSSDDAARLLRHQVAQKYLCSNCRSSGHASSPTRKPSLAPHLSSPPPPPPPAVAATTSAAPAAAAPAPPPPPPAPVRLANGVVTPLAPLPPPPPGLNNNRQPPPPPPPGVAAPQAPQANSAALLPQKTTPTPKLKMKVWDCSKIPDVKVLANENLWKQLAHAHCGIDQEEGFDFRALEVLFCQNTSRPTGSTASDKDAVDTVKPKKENTEIQVLEGKRSLNINIFLRQFRSSNADIIQRIRRGAHIEIGSERLQGLLNLLPEVDEVDILKGFTGDKTRLGNAEKFLLLLLEVPNYKLHIESMLLKEEFSANVAYLEPSINALLDAGNDLLTNKALHEVLYMIILAGNFLNCGRYAGNAAGVKLSSLQKLTDIKANKSGMNLIHFVALQAERCNPELLDFIKQLSSLESASKLTAEQLGNEINHLFKRIERIKMQVEQPATDRDIKEQMSEFLPAAEAEMAILKASIEQVESRRLKLAAFFCEDAATFKLEDCFRIFQNFCDKFKQAIADNAKRKALEEKQIRQKKSQEEQLAKKKLKAQHSGQASTPVSDSESFLGDNPSNRASPALSIRRVPLSWQTGASPDTTPNGTLRNDDLMSYLSNPNATQESSGNFNRKDYGSLDRSWARPTRRKRPALNEFVFGMDRERATSPAPLLLQQSHERLQSPLASSGAATPTSASSTPVADGPTNLLQPAAGHEDGKPRISQKWRQKIETWLQSNENDEKFNAEYQRKRSLVNANRRSLENDTENERKLDPLPEDKIMTTAAAMATTTAAAKTTTTNAITNNNNNNSSSSSNTQLPGDPNTDTGKYTRVYADWKPSRTLEQTDVAGNIQAIADAATIAKQQQPSSAEEIRQYRRQRSQEQSQSPSLLQSIAEEDRRKSLIQKLGDSEGSADRLRIYVRRPSAMDMQQPEVSKKIEPTSAVQSAQFIEQEQTFAKLLDHHKSHNEAQYMSATSKEIDADNIETPPVTRRVITTPNTTVVTVSLTDKPKHAAEERKTTAGTVANEKDEPVKFDRHAVERRTRRFKRTADYSSGNEELITPPQDIKQSASVHDMQRLKKDDHQQQQQKEEQKSEKIRNITKLEKVGRHISSINQEDVREAIRNLKSPTGTPERPWSPPRELMPNKLKLSSLGHHELNDEGFEETQSLVSDTPSHGKGDSTNSSCNEANEVPTQRSRPLSKQKTTTTSISPMGSRLAERLRIRSSPLSTAAATAATTPSSNRSQNQMITTAAGAAQPKRSSSTSRPLRMPKVSSLLGVPSSSSMRSASATGLRRVPMEPQSIASRQRDVERSSSHNSLRSSRSSINSAASTQTVVRRLPSVQRTAVVSVDSSPSKRPLAVQNTRYTTGRGVPASRSSSSGSSVGPSVIVVRSKLTSMPRSAQSPAQSLGNSTSFKENQTVPTASTTPASRLTSARSAVLVKNALNQQAARSNSSSNGNSNSNGNISQSRSNRSVSSFMRPTASSVTKRQK